MSDISVPEGRLVDRFGRVHRDLRVSLTDRCNLRCTYCMPAEGLAWIPSPDLLTVDEIVRVVGVATSLGITEVRLTGGEPLVRPEVVEIVSRLTALPNPPHLSLTTNGLRLDRLAKPLAEAGLARVNVSCDTLSRETFARLTLRDRLPDVLAGIAASFATPSSITPAASFQRVSSLSRPEYSARYSLASVSMPFFCASSSSLLASANLSACCKVATVFIRIFLSPGFLAMRSAKIFEASSLRPAADNRPAFID